MGCGGSMAYMPSIDYQLDPLGMPEYDNFYSKASENLHKLGKVGQSLEGMLDEFKVLTGLENRRDLTIGHGLVSFLVCVSCACQNDFAKVGLDFIEDFPGIKLIPSAIPAVLRSSYESWGKLSSQIDKSIDELNKVQRLILEDVDWANVVPDKLLKKAIEENWPMMEFRRLESLALKNADKLETGAAVLEKLLGEIKMAVFETSDVIMAFSELSNLQKLIETSDPILREGVVDPKEATKRYSGQISQLKHSVSKHFE